MKAISILQPWASLVAIGAKKIETRSWPTNYKGPLAIHASKRFTMTNRKLCDDDTFMAALFYSSMAKITHADQLPLGAVIATCNLVRCLYIKDDGLFKVHGFTAGFAPDMSVEEPEKSFGDYTTGRFAWILEDVKQIKPVPAKGQLGLWNWEPPEGVCIDGPSGSILRPGTGHSDREDA